jgi:S1-C subfamily serine protease
MRPLILASGFLFLVLMNVVHAQPILSNCYAATRMNSFSESLIDEFKFEINSSRTIIRQTIIQSDERMRMSPGIKKISTNTYKIKYIDSNIIEADLIDNDISVTIILEPKKKKYNLQTPHTNTDFKCEKSHIISASKPGGSDSGKGGSSGSAFFVNNKGNIITNNHVVERCGGPIKVLYNKKEYSAKAVAKDGTLDLAVLSSEIKPNQYLKLSKKSGDKLDRVVAAGYPLGYKISDELKLTAGIVSATKGWKDNINEFQIDAALNPGNSGGPVVNDAGNLFGVAVAGLADRQNLNFAIKSKAVKDFLDVNKVSYSTAMMERDMDNKTRLKLLEDSTVFIYCN